MSEAIPQRSRRDLEPLDAELFEAVKAFVLEARDRYVEYRKTGKYMSKVHDLPKYGEFETGFPHISKSFSSDVPDYEGALNVQTGEFTPIAYGDWESFKRLLELAESHEALKRSFMIDPEKIENEIGEHFWQFEVARLPLAVFDRLMHVHGDGFTEEDLNEVYCPLEQGVLGEDLPIVIAVPILLTKFEPKTTAIDANLAVVPMSKELHLARASRWGKPSSSVNETVAQAATHMLIMVNWTMPNMRGSPSPPYTQLDWYPVDTIDRFFDALRVVTGIVTGYAEAFIIPERQAWAYSYKRDLPAIIEGASARRYPSHFDDFGWLRECHPVTQDQMSEVSEVYQGLRNNDSIELAARRLSAGMLRETEDDAILDLLIGLEAVLSDQDKGELTFKLAVRTAAVLADHSDHDPSVVFGQVKQLYNYRSAVAHGNAKKAAKLRALDVAGEQISSITLATSLLREVVRHLVKRPDLSTPSDIDSKLLLRSLARPQQLDDEANAGQMG
jgi:Apea-like HEPN